MNDHKPRSKIVLNELESGPTSDQSTKVVDKVVVPSTSDSQMIPSWNTLLDSLT